ncbi:MAG: hypothetical protein R3C26_24460 [Calditrichia bacterium]
MVNDLELWWNGANGFAVIDELLRLINRFSNECLFIVNANTHSYKFINRLKTIDESLTGVIFCEPFDGRFAKRYFAAPSIHRLGIYLRRRIERHFPTENGAAV